MYNIVIKTKQHILGIVITHSPEMAKEIKARAKKHGAKVLAEFKTTLVHNHIKCFDGRDFLERFK